MKAAIIDPYFDTLGGGERYSAMVAKVLINAGYDVDIEWKDKNLLKRINDRFGIDLKGVQIVDNVQKGSGYDVCFWVSDGSIPLLNARNNILHFQIPFSGVDGKSLLNKMKLFRINSVVCNSYFTKGFIDKEYGVESIVIYPPVAIEDFKADKKENIILSVGRFSQLTQAKRQDILIKAFRNMVDKGLKRWRLVLAGGTEVGAEKFVVNLKKQIKDYPISIIESPDFKGIKRLYGKARIFWSASGFGIDEHKEPKKVEHFGITVVEAMAAGCIPIVFNAGGHKEILKDEFKDSLWERTGQLTKKTKKQIKDKKNIEKYSTILKEKSLEYGEVNFSDKFNKIL